MLSSSVNGEEGPNQGEAELVDMFSWEELEGADSTHYFNVLDSLVIIAKERNSSVLLAEIEIKRADYFYRISEYDKASHYLHSSLNLIGDKNASLKAKALKNIGLVHYHKAEYDPAIENLFQAVELLKASNDLIELSKAYDILGSINRSLRNFESSEEFLEKSLAIRQSFGDSAGIGNSYLNLGNLYFEAGKVDSSLIYFQKSKAILESTGDELRLAVLLMNMGVVAYESDKTEKSIDYYKESLEYFISLEDDYHTAIVHHNIANSSFELSREKEALYHYNQAVEFAKKIEAKGLLKTFYKNLAISYKQLNQFEKSVEYFELYDQLSEEIFSEELDNTLAEWQVKLETAEKDKEIAIFKKNEELSKADIKQRTTERNGLLVVTVLFFALATTLYLAFRGKQKANKNLSEQKAEIQKNHAEKALLLKELHHRVKNNLQIVSSLLSLQSFQTTDEHTRQAIVQGRNRVEAMSLIHQKLYQTDQITQIDLREYVENLTLNTMYSFGFTENDVDFSITKETMMVSVDIAIPLGLIINELVTNSFKHAFKTVESPKLDIILHKAEKEQLSIEIKDNGSGLPNGFEFDKKGSFGMELIQSLCRQIRAEINLLDGPGCHVELKTNA